MSNYVLQNSFDVANVPSHDFSIEKRRNLRVTDNNNGNYASNSILFDLATISNSNMYPSWHEAVLTVPINISGVPALGRAAIEVSAVNWRHSLESAARTVDPVHLIRAC